MTSTTDISAAAPRTPLGAVRRRIASALRRWCDRIAARRQMTQLLDCDDAVLKDIGVSRAEVRLRIHQYRC